MNLFGFSKYAFNEGYHRSDLIPNVDKVKFLKLYCNLIDNKEDDEFLTNVFINGGISEQVTYENFNIYKSKKKYQIHLLIILKFVFKIKITDLLL